MQLLFADQLGPHFEVEDEILLPEVLGQFAKRPYHRQKAHLILYAIRYRARSANVRLVQLNSYRDLIGTSNGPLSAIHPTSRPMLDFAKAVGAEILPARGFTSSFDQWRDFASDKPATRLEDFYRQQRLRLGLLVENGRPIGDKWNFDADNRLPPPKSGIGVPPPWEPVEDELDDQVRSDLDRLASSGVRFIGSDGPRKFAATRAEAESALAHFLEHRLDLFGPYEDAVDENDWAMSHSLLSVPMNLGLLDPVEVAQAAEQAYLTGRARLESVEGFVRQIIGWRDYVWHLYWHLGPNYDSSNYLGANVEPPEQLLNLEFEAFESRCLSSSLESLSHNGWLHHIQRLMILGNVAAQRGWNPKLMNDWFVDAFVDGTPWVMPANVVGMALFADGGKMSTKPYVAGGAYINRMTNHCGSCKFDPKIRVGERACPMTAGYWSFLANNRDKLGTNFRMRNGYAGLKRLQDLERLLDQERGRESL